MTLTVLFFAMLRDVVNRENVVVDMPGQSSVEDLFVELADRYPDLKEWRDHVRWAVNCEYVPVHTKLRDGDEVCFIPPVSGG